MDKIIITLDMFYTGVGRLMVQKPRLCCFIFVFLMGLIISFLSIAPQSRTPETLEIPTFNADDASIEVPLAPVANQTLEKLQSNAQVPWKAVMIKPGDNFSTIFKQLHLSANDLSAVVAATKSKNYFKRMKPGQTIQIWINNNNQLQQLVYNVDKEKSITLTRTADHFVAKTGAPNTTLLANSESQNAVQTLVPAPASNDAVPASNSVSGMTYVSGRVQKSLTGAAQQAGLSRKQAAQLAQMFSQSLSLKKDIHTGDQFNLLYGPNRDILAAELISRGKTYQLIRFKDPKGHVAYYTPDGKTSASPISRAPVKYTYISSYFSDHRWQPLLHFIRPHEGVDYAAPEGTPIRAAGDGRVTFVGVKNGYGKTILINHSSPYATLYGHLSGFASNLRTGNTVKQGQLIGYVGHSGLATGSHLHFEIHVNNAPRNPLTVPLPNSTSIAQAYRGQFLAYAKPILTRLSVQQQIHLAAKSDAKKNG
jgi:murein DD-endopeptidase MepM/ murein hydrolase activator NlpD